MWLRFLFLIFLFLPSSLFANDAEYNFDLHGQDLRTGKELHWQLGEKKGVVLLFLSAVCPCSDSHKEALAALAKEYKEFAFVGVHSNQDESVDLARKYFAQSPFPVLQDEEAVLADKYHALKTPHAYVFKSDGSLAYKGGVSNSSRYANASKEFLKDALEDLRQGRDVSRPEGRTLGCVISRRK